MLMEVFFNPVYYAFNPYTLPMLIVGGGILILGLFVLIREKSSAASGAFFLITLSAGLWLMGYGAAFSSLHPLVALLWVRFLHLGVIFIPSLTLLFTLTIINKVRPFQMFLWVNFIAAAVMSLLVVFSDLLIAGVRKFYWGYYAEFGVAGVPFLAYFSSILLFSLLLLVWDYVRKDDGPSRQRLRLFIAAFMIGYLAAVDFVAAFGIAVYPFGYLPVLGFMTLSTLAIRRYHLVDVTPALAADQILRLMRNAIFVLDKSQKVRVANPAACELFEMREKDLIGSDGKKLLGGILFSGELAGLESMGMVLDREVVYRNREGDERFLNLSATAVKNETAEAVAYVYLCSDITLRKQEQSALLQKTVDLARTEAEREQMKLFAYSASHDLRNPLQNVIGMADLLEKTLESGGPPEKAKDYLTRIQKGAMRMSSLIDSLLSLSKVTATEEGHEYVDLNAVVKDVLTDVSEKIREMNAKVEVGQLPAVWAIRSQMYDLLLNLILNGLKFHKADKPPTVKVTGEPKITGRVEISVQDDGIGFEEKYVSKIFLPFERLHSRFEYEGHGLGLAICQRIMTKNKGRISVTSTPGQGSTFRIELPSA